MSRPELATWRAGPCGSKRWYANDEEATADIPRVRQELTDAGRLKGELHAYRCPQCPGWHLTTQCIREFNAHATNGRRDVPIGPSDMVNARALLRSFWAGRTNP